MIAIVVNQKTIGALLLVFPREVGVLMGFRMGLELFVNENLKDNKYDDLHKAHKVLKNQFGTFEVEASVVSADHQLEA